MNESLTFKLSWDFDWNLNIIVNLWLCFKSQIQSKMKLWIKTKIPKSIAISSWNRNEFANDDWKYQSSSPFLDENQTFSSKNGKKNK